MCVCTRTWEVDLCSSAVQYTPKTLSIRHWYNLIEIYWYIYMIYLIINVQTIFLNFEQFQVKSYILCFRCRQALKICHSFSLLMNCFSSFCGLALVLSAWAFYVWTEEPYLAASVGLTDFSVLIFFCKFANSFCWKLKS